MKYFLLASALVKSRQQKLQRCNANTTSSQVHPQVCALCHPNTMILKTVEILLYGIASASRLVCQVPARDKKVSRKMLLEPRTGQPL